MQIEKPGRGATTPDPRPIPREGTDVNDRTARRFWAKVEKRDDGCWQWLGHLTPAGYGYFWSSHRKHGAHRFSYEEFVGPIPDGTP